MQLETQQIYDNAVRAMRMHLAYETDDYLQRAVALAHEFADAVGMSREGGVALVTDAAAKPAPVV